MSRELEDILKEKLYDNTPSQGVPSWQQMQRRMELYANAHPEAGALRRKTSLRRTIYAVAATLLAAAVGGYLLLHHAEMPQKHLFTAIQSTPATPSTAMGTSSTSDGTSDLNRILKSARTIRVFNPTSSTKRSLAAIMNDESAEARPMPDYAGLGSHDAAQNATSSPSQSPETDRQSTTHDDQQQNNATTPSTPGTNGKRSYPLEALLAEAPSTRSPRHTPWVAGAFADASTLSGIAPAGNGLPMSGVIGLPSSNPSVPTVPPDELKHKLPMSFGLSVRKYVTPRLGIETGLNFSILKSSFDGKDEYDMTYDQKLLYIGLPVSATYSFLNSKRFDLYLIGGGMVEKALSAKGTTRIFAAGPDPAAIVSQKLSAKGFLWSLHTGAGFGYNFIDQMGLYVEPTANYYFLNHQQPASYHTKNRWNFDVRMGLRFNF